MSRPAAPAPLPVVASARGVYLYDTEGNDYLDASSGVLNVNLGHSHPGILSALAEQARSVTFVHRSQFGSRPQQELTARLLEIAPEGTAHVEYANSGSEANETALRIALAHQHRRHGPERTAVLSERPSYHGMTAGALSLTGQPPKVDASFAPLIANGVAQEPVLPRPGSLRAGREEWDAALERVGRDRVAAIVFEPVGGSSSGAAPMEAETLRWLRAEADRHGFLLIADEVMSGFGRAGTWWGCDHAGVAPDLLTSGKGLTGGYTSLAVTFVGERVAAALDRPVGALALGHTMSGNPLAAAVSLAVLTELREGGLPAQAARRGDELRGALETWTPRHPVVTGVRGRGLMLGLGLAGDPSRPLELSRRVVAEARRQGLVLCPGGIDTVTESVMVAPPLTVSDTELADLQARLDATLHAVGAAWTVEQGLAEQGPVEEGPQGAERGVLTEPEPEPGLEPNPKPSPAAAGTRAP